MAAKRLFLLRHAKSSWDDPGLEIPWPRREAQISPRDAALPTLEVLLGELRSAWEDG